MLLLPLLFLFALCSGTADAQSSVSEPGVPILLYHRFGPMVADGMTVTTTVFESHLIYL
jgi:hypothetical protein